MDATRFDAFVRTLANRRSRRAALGASGASLLSAVLGRPTRAQDATPVPAEPASVLYVQVAEGGQFHSAPLGREAN